MSPGSQPSFRVQEVNRGMARPLRVLIVEDSADDAELMLIELRRRGFRPVVAAGRVRRGAA